MSISTHSTARDTASDTVPAVAAVVIAARSHEALVWQDALSNLGFSPVTVVTDAADAIAQAAQDLLSDPLIVIAAAATDAAPIVTRISRAGFRHIVVRSGSVDAQDASTLLTQGATAVFFTGGIPGTPPHAAAALSLLTPREIDVIRMVAQGRTNKWIGEKLQLSALTVKSHLARVGRKLGTGDRAHTVAVAMRSGVID